MTTQSRSVLHKPLPDRGLKLFVVGIGLGFWLTWGLATLLLADGNPLTGTESCAPIHGTGIFLECTSGRLTALAATWINAIIVLTLAMPIFVMAAQVDPAVAPLAVPGVMFHLIGLPAGMFVLVRSLRRISERLIG